MPRTARGSTATLVAGAAVLLVWCAAPAEPTQPPPRSAAVPVATAAATEGPVTEPLPGPPAKPPVATVDVADRAIRESSTEGVSDAIPVDGYAGAPYPSCQVQSNAEDGLIALASEVGGRAVDPCGNVLDSDSESALLLASATIDTMTTTLGYSQSYVPYSGFQLFSHAQTYYLNTGSSWASGAGTYYLKSATFDHAEVSGSTVRYFLRPPADGIVYQQTDYDSGDHSAQGSLGTTSLMVLEATIGSSTAVMVGSVTVTSNDPTSYGEPRFNFYSALVGSAVPYQLSYQIAGGATWQSNTFSTNFTYYGSGWVDFAHPTYVPGVTSLEILGTAQVPPHTSIQFVATAHYDNGMQRSVTDSAAWSAQPSSVSISRGVLTTQDFDVDRQPITLHAEFTAQGTTVTADKTVLGRLTPPADPETWPMFQANERHLGYIPRRYEPDTFSLRWQRILANGSLNPVASANGEVFASIQTYFGAGPHLWALDARDGETLWTQSFSSPFSVNPPAWAYGNVYIQTCDHSTDTWLHSFDATTGQRVFKAPFQAQWERYYAPTILGGTVYIDGGYYGGMYAFDAFSGSSLWFSSLPQYDQWTPGVNEDSAYAYVGSYSPGLYVFDRRTGQQRYVIPDPGFSWNGWSMNLAPVVLGDGDVLAIHNGRLLRFDVAAHAIGWQRAASWSGQPSVANGVIYAVDGSRVVALDEVTGSPLWSWTPPAGTPVSPLIVTDTHLFVSTASSTYAVDLLSHETAWSYPAGGAIALGDENLYIAGPNGTLVAIAAAPVTPSPPVSIEIRGPAQAVEFQTTPYRAFVRYADGRERDRTRSTTWTLVPGTYASINDAGGLTVPEMFVLSQDDLLKAKYTEAETTVESSRTIHEVVSVTLAGFVERNRQKAAAIQQSVRGQIDEAVMRERAILRALQCTVTAGEPAVADPFRTAIGSAIAADQQAQQALDQAVFQLERSRDIPLPCP